MPKFYNIKGKRISARTFTNDRDISFGQHETQTAHNNNVQNIIANTFHKQPKKENKKDDSESLCIIC
jgi:hypothetical protein